MLNEKYYCDKCRREAYCRSLWRACPLDGRGLYGVGCTLGAVCLSRDEPLNVTLEYVAGGSVSDTRALCLTELISSLLYGEPGKRQPNAFNKVETTKYSDSWNVFASWLCEPKRDCVWAGISAPKRSVTTIPVTRRSSILASKNNCDATTSACFQRVICQMSGFSRCLIRFRRKRRCWTGNRCYQRDEETVGLCCDLQGWRSI